VNGTNGFLLALGLALVGVGNLGAQEPQKPAGEQEAPKPVEKPAVQVTEPVAGDPLFAPLAVGADTLKVKTDTWLVLSFGPRALIYPLVSSGIRMAKPNYNYPNDWHQGMQGYGRIYGNEIGTKVASETARYAAAALLHEDYRYRPATETGFFPRTLHAIGFVFVDRSDSGRPRLAVSNFAGAAAGGFTANLWLPDGFNDASHGAERMGTRFGGFAIQNVIREFSPEIFRAAHELHVPVPHLRIPDWWTKDIQVARGPGL